MATARHLTAGAVSCACALLIAGTAYAACTPANFLDNRSASPKWASSRVKVGKRPQELASFDKRLSVRTLNREPGAHLSGYALAPERASRAVAVVFPGNAMWCRTTLLMIRHITSDVTLVCFDYRTMDGSVGPVTTANLMADAREVIADARNRQPENQDLFVVGLSFGGIIAANMLRQPGVRRGILDSTFTEVGSGCPQALDPLTQLEASTIPVLVAFGGKDRTMIRAEKTLWRNARAGLSSSRVSVIEFPTAGHLVIEGAAYGEDPAAKAWFDAFLAPIG